MTTNLKKKVVGNLIVKLEAKEIYGHITKSQGMLPPPPFFLMGKGSVFNYINVNFLMIPFCSCHIWKTNMRKWVDCRSKNLFFQTNCAVKNQAGRTEANGHKNQQNKRVEPDFDLWFRTQIDGLQAMLDRMLGIMPSTNSISLYPWVKTPWAGDTGGVILNQQD